MTSPHSNSAACRRGLPPARRAPSTSPGTLVSVIVRIGSGRRSSSPTCAPTHPDGQRQPVPARLQRRITVGRRPGMRRANACPVAAGGRMASFHFLGGPVMNLRSRYAAVIGWLGWGLRSRRGPAGLRRAGRLPAGRRDPRLGTARLRMPAVSSRWRCRVTVRSWRPGLQGPRPSVGHDDRAVAARPAAPDRGHRRLFAQRPDLRHGRRCRAPGAGRDQPPVPAVGHRHGEALARVCRR